MSDSTPGYVVPPVLADMPPYADQLEIAQGVADDQLVDVQSFESCPAEPTAKTDGPSTMPLAVQ